MITGYTEIKFDKDTLPEDDQAVSFLLLYEEEWKNGIYIEKESMFWVSDDEYYYPSNVLGWKPLQAQ